MRRLPAFLLLAATLTIAVAPALAQVDEQTLAEAQAARKEAEERAASLARRASTIEDEALKSEAEAQALGAEIAGAEALIEEARQRETLASDRLGVLRESFARQRAPLSRMMAALQRLARRPMILLVMRPASLRDYVRTRAMVDAIAPQIARQTKGVRGNLAEMRELSGTATQARMAREQASARLVQQRAQLAASGAESRVEARELAEAAGEARREATLRGVEAGSIAALVSAQARNARTEAALTELTGPLLPAGRPEAIARPIRPAMPIKGTVLAGYGEKDVTGSRADGITIAAAPSAPVGAPLAGTVLFADIWRGYGTVVIIRNEGGFVSVIAGLADAQVKRGTKVKRGEVLGRAPTNNGRILYELRRNGRAVHPLLAV